MAVTATLLDGQLDDVARSTYITASKSPTSNRLQLLAVELHDATPATPPTPTVTGCGLTWDLVTTLLFATSNQRKIAIYRAQGASPSTGTLSIAVGSAVTRAFWHWLEFAGMKIGNNGADAVVQFASNTSTPTWTGANPETFSLSITLAAFGNAGNAAFSFWGTNGTAAGNSLAATPKAGWTEISEQFGPAVATGLCESQFRDSPDTIPSVDITKTGTTVHNAAFAGIALEVAAESGGGGKPSFNLITTGHVTTTNHNSATTANIPAPGGGGDRVYVIFVQLAAVEGGTPGTSPAGAGLTWVTLDGIGTGFRLMACYYAVGQANGTAVTFTHGNSNPDLTSWVIFEILGADLTTPLLNSVTQQTGSGATSCDFILITPNDAVIFGLGVGGNAINPVTPRAGWTELADFESATGLGDKAGATEVQVIAGSDTHATGSWATAGGFVGVAANVKLAALLPPRPRIVEGGAQLSISLSLQADARGIWTGQAPLSEAVALQADGVDFRGVADLDAGGTQTRVDADDANITGVSE